MQKLSFQFWLDIPLVFRVARQVDMGVTDRAKIAQELEVGMDKALCFLRWAQLLGLIKVEESKEPNLHITDLCSTILQLGERDQDTLQLIYFTACKRHLITSFLVNDVAYPQRASGFAVEEAHRLIEERSQEFKASLSTLKTQVTRHLKGLIHRNGLGNLGLIRRVERIERKQRNRYVVTPFEPSPLVAAYIIYTSWPPNTAKVAIKEIVSGRNSLGRIFFLDEMQVMTILRKLEERGFVKVETVAGLNQIGINPKLTANDFLDMLINEAKQ